MDAASSTEPQVVDSVIAHLVRQLESTFRTQKKASLRDFAKYYFKALPVMTQEQIQRLYVGRKGTGLLSCCGEAYWRTRRLKFAATIALDLLSRLLDPDQNPAANDFISVFVRFDASVYEAMHLEKHIKDERGDTEIANKVIACLKEHGVDIDVDTAGTFAVPTEEPKKKGHEYRLSFDGAISSDAFLRVIHDKPGQSDKYSGIKKLLTSFFTSRPKESDIVQSGILQRAKVFGQELDCVIKYHGKDGMPLFLAEALEFILKHGKGAEGIFRISGNQSDIIKLKQTIDFGTFTGFSDTESPHNVAGLVKAFLRELPSPLFPFHAYQVFIHAGKERQFRLLQPLIQQLPEPNKTVSLRLIEFLAAIAQHQTTNKMGALNLAIVIVPNILRPRVETFESIAHDTPMAVSAFGKLLELEMETAATSVEDVKEEVSDDWRRVWDPVSNAYYLFNEDTKESRWEDDKDGTLAADTEDHEEEVYASRQAESSKSIVVQELDMSFRSAAVEETAASPSSPLSRSRGLSLAAWEEQYDKDGNKYFYNTMTGTSQWESPQAPLHRPTSLDHMESLNATQEAAYEWTIDSSGGTYPAVSWFQNPQFLVCCDTSPVRIQLSIDAPLVGSPLGFHVVRLDPNRIANDGRVSTIAEEHDLLYFGPFEEHYNCTVELQLGQEGPLCVMIVPATADAGYPGSFEFQVACLDGHKLHVDQIKDPDERQGWYLKTVEESWTPTTSGGCYPNYNSWRANPQYLITLPDGVETCRLLVNLVRVSTEMQGSIGFYVFSNSGPAPQKLHVDEGDVVYRSSFLTSGDVVAECTLRQSHEQSFIVMPCQFFPGIQEDFHLCVFSDVKIKMDKVRPDRRWSQSNTIEAAWTGVSAGGCRNFKTWRKSPTFQLDTVQLGLVLVILSQSSESDLLPIGMYILDKDGKVRAKGAFMATPEVFCVFDLQQKYAPYSVVACTFHPGQEKTFQIQVFSAGRVSLHPLIKDVS